MISPTRKRTCPACGSSDGELLVFDGLVGTCTCCGLGWTAAELEAPEHLYDESYHRGEGYEDYFQPRARRRESALRLRWLLSAAQPKTLLEVGAAAGFFLDAARRAGIDAEGIEIADGAAEYGRTQLGVQVLTASLEEAVQSGAVDRRFDAVCAFHVLEHVVDPLRFLDAAGSLLGETGVLALEVPNRAAAAAVRLGSAWPHIQPRFHHWHFTPDSIRRLLGRGGFDVVRLDTVFSRFYWRPVARQRHLRSLLVADVAASHSLRMTHPSLGDALRVVAVRTPSGDR